MTKINQGRLRLGIVGCGSITESAHLPAALTCPGVELVALADPNRQRAQFLEGQFGLDGVATNDYKSLFGRVDAVIVAAPNALHADLGTEFLSKGIHVLCEKPLATTTKECERMCEAAERTSAVLAVGFVTRFFPSLLLTKQLLESEFLGSVASFEYEFGTPGGWSTFSGYNLQRSTSGGGVLVVSGSHFVDRMLYLFDGVGLESYSDDSRGGVEANCVVHFSASVNQEPVVGRVALSKTHLLKNRLRIKGTKGVLEIGERQQRSVTYYPAGTSQRCEISDSKVTQDADANYFRIQLEDFAQAITAGRPPRVNGEQGARSVALMERCYEIASHLEEPWCDAALSRLAAALPPVTPPPLEFETSRFSMPAEEVTR